MSSITRLFDIPLYQLEKYPTDDALCHKRNGQWEKLSTQQLVDDIDRAARGLVSMGFQPGDKIAMIVSMDRPEWHVMDYAILKVGAVDVPMYPTISSSDYEFIFNDADVKMCIVSDKELYDKVMAAKPQCPTLTQVLSFDELDGVTNWKTIMDAGTDEHQSKVNELSANVKPSDLATLIYTSGTTGNPKGVMLSHDNLVSNVMASQPRVPVDHHATALSFLPICHSYERMLVYLYMYMGVSVYFAESMETIGDNIKEVRPHIFTAVPRLLEKVYDKVYAKGANAGGLKGMIFRWAVKQTEDFEIGKAPGFKLRLADKLVFSKIREGLGNRICAVASGSAALAPRLAKFFTAVGIPIFEGYGLTETSPVVSVNAATSGVKFGSVGKVIDGVEVKIAADGEILVKGPNVMQGYYNRPDLTAEVIKDGWFHTGDIGEFDDEGFLRITDRKKEMFKTSGGKYIAPQPMENTFKQSRFIEQIMVIGDGQKFPAALVVPSFEFLRGWCERKNIPYTSDEEIIQNEKVIARIDREINEINQQFGNWEQVKKFELMPRLWTIEDGELTPTLKFKRKVIMEKYADSVKRIYG